MKKIFLLIPLFLFLSCGSDLSISPNDTFVKYFGVGGSYEMKDMITSTDGSNVLMYGNKTAESVAGGNDTNFFIIITDQNGSVVTEMEYPIIHQSDDFKNEDDTFIDKYQVEEASRITAIDGGYLVVGTSQYPVLNEELEETTVNLIMYGQLDADLNLVGDWLFLGDSVNNYVGVDIAEAADGGILVAGYTDVKGTNDLYYAKIGGTNDDWIRNGIPERPASDDRLIRALPTSTGKFALFGQTDAITEGKGGVNVERTIISQDGQIGNSLIYGNTSDAGDSDIDDFPFDVVEKPGGFAVIGYSDLGGGNEKPFLMSVDLTGAATNEVLYDVEFGTVNARGFSITQTLTNDIILIGELIDFEDDQGTQRNNELLFMRTDQAGAQIGEPKNFGVENGDDVAIRALTTAEGNILVGATYDFGGGLTLFALLKMNSDGELKQ